VSGSLYTITMASATVIASGEIITIRAATALSSRASILQIYSMSCGQHGTSTSQELGIRWGLKASAFSTMSTATPAPTIQGIVASAITGSTSGAASSCGVNSSSNGGGTFTVMGQEGFNNLNGWIKIFTPEERPLVLIDQTFTLALVGTPTTLTSWEAMCTFEEIT